jgi:hypothetical protein
MSASLTNSRRSRTAIPALADDALASPPLAARAAAR